MLLSTHNSSYPSAVGLRRFLVGLTYAGVVLALFVVGSLAFFPQSAQPSAGKVLADGSLDLSSLNRAQAASRDNDNSDQLAAQLAQREQALNRLADLNAKRERVLSTPTSEFTMATFNVQGSSHRRGGSSRIMMAASLLNGASVDVASFQEFQRDQRLTFIRRMSGTYGVWPGMAAPEGDAHNAVVWRKSRFDLVTGTSRAYYYFNGRRVNFPLVKLRDKSTGAEFWVTSYHNPASGVLGMGNQGRWRSINVSRQIANANEIIRTGVPLLIAGDMNEWTSYFCKMVLNTSMHAANGGSDNGGCNPPAGRTIDWIMGSPKVEFSGYVRNDGSFVDRTSDHPFFYVQVKLTGQRPTRD